MRIACLQFAPKLGDVDNNLTRAEAVLSRGKPENLDLLVLPELAFSGYNFKSLAHISPYLEYSGSGITALWARTTALKYDCVVTVGYPEKVDISSKWPTSPEYYSSAITINSEGETISNYRKSFLFPQCDERWALEGRDGFYDGDIPKLGHVAIGICMDLNPYKYEAPWSAWEFAYHILHRECNLAVFAMSWLTREDARSYSRRPKDPDMETLAYWVARLEPLIRAEGEDEIIVVFANRCGVEDEAVYSGTSAVLGIQHGEVKLYGVLGRGEKELLIVDTKKKPQAKLVHDKTLHAPRQEAKTYPTHSVASGGSGSSLASKSSRATNRSSTSNSSLASNGSVYDDDTDPIASIGEVLAASIPVSPVEPRNPHAFFSKVHTKDSELRPLVSTMEKKQDIPIKPKGLGINGVNGKAFVANESLSEGLDRQSPGIPFAGVVSGVALEMATMSSQAQISSQETRRQLKSARDVTVQHRLATPSLPQGPQYQEESPDDIVAVFERPSSPKSRNASRNRNPGPIQEEALYTHDLAGVDFEPRRSISRASNHSRSNSITQQARSMTAGMTPHENSKAVSVTFRGQSGPEVPHSAGEGEVKIPTGVELVQDSDGSSDCEGHSDSDSDNGMQEKGLGEGMFGPPRPKSVGW